MSLLCMAVWDTVENKRSTYTDRCLESIKKTVDFGNERDHRLIVVDNGSCFETTEVLRKWLKRIRMRVIYNRENKGQATAINQGWALGWPAQILARIDNDVELLTPGWLDKLEDCISRDPNIGIAALRHNDLLDHPDADGWLKTSLHALPHHKGQEYLVVEKINHALGAVQVINPKLFDKIGYLKAYGPYGLEDVDYAERCRLAGFYSCYFAGAWFNDLDREKNLQYQQWKEQTAKEHMPLMDQTIRAYRDGTLPICYGVQT